MQAAFHQGLDLARGAQFDGTRGRGMAVFRRLEAEPRDGHVGLLGGGADLVFRADQNRCNEALVACFNGRSDRLRIAGMDNGGQHRRHVAGIPQEALEPIMPLQRDLGHRHTAQDNFSDGAITVAVPVKTS